MKLTEYEIKGFVGNRCGSTKALGLEPFLGGPFALEKRYCKQGERLSWSEFPSLFLVAQTGGGAELVEKLLGLLFRYFGGEVIELTSYWQFGDDSSIGSGSVAENFVKHVEEQGYFYGAVDSQVASSCPRTLNSIILVRDPREVLVQEYEMLRSSESGEAGDSLAKYVCSSANWQRMKTFLDHAKSVKDAPNVLVRRVEDLGADPSRTLLDFVLFSMGHEPTVIANDLVARFIGEEVQAELKGKSFRSKLPEDILAELWNTHRETLEEFGYGETTTELTRITGGGSLRRIN